jgi:predicted RNA-binding protein YlxR (DUF448 family)
VNKRHVPVRQCVVCKARAEKRGLMRFVQGSDGWIVDPTGRKEGRGAYLCSPECARAVTKNKRYRALSGAAGSAPWKHI